MTSNSQRQRWGGRGRVLIVGAGIAGVSAAEAVREAAPDADVTLISRERELPYYRLNLIRYIAGDISEQRLPLHPEGWYAERAIELRIGEEVRQLELSEKEAVLANRERVSFDRLILATGAHPFVPAVPGVLREGVVSLRTAEHARQIMDLLSPGLRCVCIGGGLSGLEVAAALVRRDVEVTVVEERNWLLPLQLNRRAGEIVASYMLQLGVKLHTGSRAREIVGDERVAGVELEDGAHLEADCVVISTGVRSNCYTANRAGLAVNEGLIVNDYLAASHPGVFGAGDVAEHRGVLYGIWSAAQKQGRIAGLNAAGVPTEFSGLPRSNMLRVVGLSVFSIGVFAPEEAGFEVIEGEADGRYARFVFRQGHLLGAVLVGDTSLVGAVRSCVEQKRDCSNLLRLKPTATEIIEHLKGAAGGPQEARP